jgi:hypothetical protein
MVKLALQSFLREVAATAATSIKYTIDGAAYNTLLKPGYRSRLAFDTYGGLDLFSEETPANFDESIRSIGDEKAMNTLAVLPR